MTHATSRRRALRALFGLALVPATALLAAPARSHGDAGASAASSLSLSLPVAVLSAAPVMINSRHLVRRQLLLAQWRSFTWWA